MIKKNKKVTTYFTFWSLIPRPLYHNKALYPKKVQYFPVTCGFKFILSFCQSVIKKREYCAKAKRVCSPVEDSLSDEPALTDFSPE